MTMQIVLSLCRRNPAIETGPAIRGSVVGNREDMAEALAFAADGKFKADIELQPLSAIHEVFDRLEHGRVAGRVVLDFLGTPARDDTATMAEVASAG